MTLAFIAALSIFIDLSVCFLQKNPLFLMQCLFYVLPFTAFAWPWILAIGFMALLPSFCLQGVLGADLIIMVPLYAFLWYMRQTTYLPLLVRTFLAVLCVIIHAIVMRGLFVLSFWQCIIDVLFCLGMLYLWGR